MDKDTIIAGANLMSDKGYGIGNEPDYLKFKAGRMQYVMVKYRDSGMATYTYFWKDENEHITTPFFDTEREAWDWIKGVSEWDNWKPNKDID